MTVQVPPRVGGLILVAGPHGLGCWPICTIGDDTSGSSMGASPSYGGEQQEVGMGKEIALCLTN